MAVKATPLKAARILVVDDEPHIARLLEYNLQREGYQVKVAYDGEQALAEVDQFSPDALLLDLMLPRLSGLEVLKKLRADAKNDDLVIFVLSAHAFGDTSNEVIEAGANRHATKPIAPSTLLSDLVELGVPPLID